MSVDELGRVDRAAQVTAAFREGRHGWFGLRRAAGLTLTGRDVGEIDINFIHQVEDGPFYQRYLVEARTSRGEVGRGVAERVVPSRLDHAWHRPFVNMRVDRRDAARSMWLPLFSGAASGRWSRLVSSLLRGRAARSEARP